MKTKDRRKSKNVQDVRNVPLGKQAMGVKQAIRGDTGVFNHDLKYPKNYNNWVDPDNDVWKDKPVKNVKSRTVSATKRPEKDRLINKFK